jgi:hypothetical protein
MRYSFAPTVSEANVGGGPSINSKTSYLASVLIKKIVNIILPRDFHIAV